MTLEHKKLLFL